MVLPVFVIFLINLLVSVALAPKAQKPRAASIEDFDIPTAEQDRPIPVIFGTKEITGANVVWHGDLSTKKIKKGNIFGSTTVGYKYSLGMHLALCHGPVDEISRISMAEKVAWSGSVTGNGTIAIDAQELYGGKEREGGVQGSADVMMGGPAQTANAYLQTTLGSPMPAFRGVCSLVWHAAGASPGGGYLGNTPYIKPWAVVAKRILAGWQDDAPWYPETAAVGIHMNPAHIIYQALTDPEWGMGEPAARIDDDGFRAAADRLLYEGFGLSLIWNQAGSIDDFLQVVIDHIGAALAFNKHTNQYVLTLVRADYDPDTLPEFGPSDITITSLQRRTWGECVNELTLTYTDPDTLKNAGITVQDLGNIQAQQARIAEKVSFPGLHSHDLARDVAARELAARSTPLARIEFTASRKFWQYTLGHVVKITWPRNNLAATPFRIMGVRGGTLRSGTITVEALEDIYALSTARYTQPQPADTPTPPVVTPEQPIGTPNILGTNAVTPPVSPQDGDRYLVPIDVESGSAWSGHEGQIAEWDADNEEWIFVDVPPGVIIYDQGEEQHIVTDGAGTVTPINFQGQPGVASGAVGAFAADQGYLWYIGTNANTEVSHNSGNVPSYTFERRVRSHGVVVDILQTNPLGTGPGDLSWQLHWRHALTGERLGSSNFGGRLSDIWHDGYGARYFYAVGDESGMGGDTPTLRKIDVRSQVLGNTAAGITAELYQKGSVVGFTGVAKIGDVVYISVTQTSVSEHRIYRLDADTLALLDDTWSYTGDNRPGALVVNPYGADGNGPPELWALAADFNFGAAGAPGTTFQPIPQSFVDGVWYGRNELLVETSPLVASEDGGSWAIVFDPEGATATTPGTNQLVKDGVGRYHAVRGSTFGRSNTTVLLDAWTWGTPAAGGSRSYGLLRLLNGTVYAFSYGSGSTLHPRAMSFNTGTGLWVDEGTQAGLEDFIVVDVIWQGAPFSRFLIFGYTVDESSPPDTFYQPAVYEAATINSAWSLLADLLTSGFTSQLMSAVAVNGDTIGVAMRGAVAVGPISPPEIGVLAVSTDGGDTWSFPSVAWPDTSPQQLGLTGIAWDGLQWLASGRNWIARSSDLLAWTIETDVFADIGGVAPAVSTFQPNGTGTTVVTLSVPSGASGGYSDGSDTGVVWSEIGLGPDVGGVAFRINLTTGAVEGVFTSPYVGAIDAEFAYNFQGDHPEMWIAYAAYPALPQAARVARHRRTDGAILAEIAGDDAQVLSGPKPQLWKDGELISYGKIVTPRVFDVRNLQTTTPDEALRGEYDAEVEGFFLPPYQIALDQVPDHPDPSSIDGAEVYVGVYDERTGNITRIPLSEVLGGGGGGGGVGGGTALGSGARVSRTTDQTIPASTTTALEFDTEAFDTDEYFVGSDPSLLTVARAGIYQVSSTIEWDSSTDGERTLSLRANGTTVFGIVKDQAVDGLAQNVVGLVSLAAGEYVEARVHSTAAGAVDVVVGAGTPQIAISRVGPMALPALMRGATWVRQGAALTAAVNEVPLQVTKASRVFGVTCIGGPDPGSCVIDIRRVPLGGYPPDAGDSIVGSSPPLIAGGRTSTDTTLTGWDIDIDAGDVLVFVLVSVTTFKFVSVQLHLEETE